MSMAIPVLPALPAGYVVQESDLQSLVTAAQFSLNKPIARIIDSTGGQAIGASFGAVTFTGMVYDPDGMWSVSTPTRLTIQTPGWYTARYGVNVGTVGKSFVSCLASTSGPNNPVGTGVASGNYWGGYSDMNASNFGWATGGGDWPFYLYQGDYLQVFIQADSTGASTGVTGPTGSSTAGSYFELGMVSI
jgi:hypothetical protein